jgi:hypothetical protein
VIQNSGDTFKDKDQLTNATCNLIAIVKMRDRMVRFLPGGKFMPPTSMDGNSVTGFQSKPLTWLGEGKDFLEAYHALHEQVVG